MNRKHAPTINNINKTKKRQPPAYKKKHKGESTSVYLLYLSAENKQLKGHLAVTERNEGQFDGVKTRWTFINGFVILHWPFKFEKKKYEKLCI